MFMFAIIETWVSSNAMSMYCPSPVRARWNSAARIATVAYMPVERSATATPTRSGAPPGRSSASPVMLIRPPIAWMMKS